MAGSAGSTQARPDGGHGARAARNKRTTQAITDRARPGVRGRHRPERGGHEPERRLGRRPRADAGQSQVGCDRSGVGPKAEGGRGGRPSQARSPTDGGHPFALPLHPFTPSSDLSRFNMIFHGMRTEGYPQEAWSAQEEWSVCASGWRAQEEWTRSRNESTQEKRVRKRSGIRRRNEYVGGVEYARGIERTGEMERAREMEYAERGCARGGAQEGVRKRGCARGMECELLNARYLEISGMDRIGY